MKKSKERARFWKIFLASLMTTLVFPVSSMAAGNDVTKVDIDNSAYTRETVLEVEGKPFWYNGIQIRIDKLADDPNYACSGEELQKLFKQAAEDGFTVANSQIRWTDVQPNHKVNAEASTYVYGGKNADKIYKGSGGIKVQYDTNPDNQALGYVKFKIDDMTPEEMDAAKIRLYHRGSLSASRKVEIYALPNDDWDYKTLKWNDNIGHNGYDVTNLKKVAESPDNDKIKAQNYYDFDITDYIKSAEEAKDGTVSFIIKEASNEKGLINFGDFDDNPVNGVDGRPQLIYSDAEEFDYTYLDQVIDYAKNAGLKFEVLWFGTDTCSISADARVPSWVLRNYQKTLDANKNPLYSKGGASGAAIGVYQYNLCKNDLELRKKEALAIKKVFDHIATRNDKVVIGCQVSNEPGVGLLHGSKKTEYCHCDTCEAKKAQAQVSSKEFREITLWEYNNNLAKAVKDSDYPVWTRCNFAESADVEGVAYNEAKRAQGETYLDFIGIDHYRKTPAQLATEGVAGNQFAQGKNLSMLMELGQKDARDNGLYLAEDTLATLSGGAFVTIYDASSSDGCEIYSYDKATKTFSPMKGKNETGDEAEVTNLFKTNRMLKKIGYDLATKKPGYEGGNELVYFNATSLASGAYKENAILPNKSITFHTSQNGVGIAVQKSENEVALLSTKGDTFTYDNVELNGIESAELGYYDEDNQWHKESEVTLKDVDGVVTAEIPAYSCLRIVTKEGALKSLEGYGEVADTTELQKLYDQYKDLEQGNYTDESWNRFQTALANTKAILDKQTPRKKEVETQYNVLQEAINTLYINTDLSKKEAYVQLKAVIAEAKAEKENPGYSQEDITVLENAITRAEALLADEDDPAVTASHVATAVENLKKTLEDFRGTIVQFPELPRVLLKEDFQSESDEAFGFDKGAVIKDGVLQLTSKNMKNGEKGVKYFSADIASRTEVDVTFDWTPDIQSTNGKTGIEFRDSYGRFLFGLVGAGKAGGKSVLRYSVEATATDNEKYIDPTWIEIAGGYQSAETYKVHLQADFTKGLLSFQITDKAGKIKASEKNVKTAAGSLSQMISGNYWTIDSKGKEYPIIHSIDNFTIRGNEEDSELAGKTLYAFGDGIVCGYQYEKASFPNFVAEKEGMNFTNANKYANNGASVVKDGSNWILNQIQNAPAESPDYIIFDGGINNVSEETVIGEISKGGDLSSLDNTTFAGAFEEIIGTMCQKWPNAKVVYVAVHKTNSCDGKIQETLHQIEKEICAKWSVTMADLYTEAGIDCLNNKENLTKYAFDSVDSTTGLPISNSKSATHPNLAAIEQFYVPIVGEALNNATSIKVPSVPEADKTILQNLYDANKDKVSADYTKESFMAFEEAMTAVKNVLDKEDATQEEVDAAKTALESAVKGLKEKTLASIRIVSAPEKVEYIQGEELDLGGLVVEAVYSDDSVETVTNDVEISGYDSNQSGKQTITVTYEGKTVTFEVTVKSSVTLKESIPGTGGQVEVSIPVEVLPDEILGNTDNIHLSVTKLDIEGEVAETLPKIAELIKASLNMTEVNVNEANTTALEVKLVDTEENEIQFKGDVLVVISKPEGYSYNLKLFHNYQDDLKEVEFRWKDENELEFNTSSFSYFTLTDLGEVDWSELDNVLAVVDTLNQDEYTPESWENLRIAADNADAVKADAKSDQQRINVAVAELQEAMNALVKKQPAPSQINKTTLGEMLKTANALNQSDYTKESWDAFKKVLDEATMVYADEVATQEEVDEVVSGLESAMAQLEKVNGGDEKPSVEELKALVEKAEKLDKDDYVASTWDNFAQALEAAKAVLDSDNATQAEIETTKENLQKAMDALLLKTGWQVINGKKYYYGEDGTKKTGWQKIDGKKYYFGDENDGVMKTYWQQIDGKWYFFGNDGVMRTYWQKIWGKWYFLGNASDGAMKTGWQKIWDKWYYLGSANDGAMKTGWQQVYGKWYYLGSAGDGSMRTYWQQINGKWYFFGRANDGAMKTGWQKIWGKWYYLGGKQDGSMKSNTWIGNYYLDKSGVWSKTRKSK